MIKTLPYWKNLWKSWLISYSADQDKRENSIIFIVNKPAWFKNVLKYFIITLYLGNYQEKQCELHMDSEQWIISLNQFSINALTPMLK